MKTIITAAAALLGLNVSATDIYPVLGEGNSDLSTRRLSAEDFAGVPPSIGDSVDRYHGFADGNPDLFVSNRTSWMDGGGTPDIYMDFSGNPDLHF